MKSARRLVGVVSVLSVLWPAAVFAAPEGPTRLEAAARGQIVEAPGVDARAEVVTFDEDLAPSLLRVSADETVWIAGWPVAPGERADVRLTRFEIYAPGARIWKVEGDLRTEVPRSRMAFFQGTAEGDPDTRIFIATDPDTGRFEGLSISPHGTYEIRPFGGSRGHLVTVPEYFLPDNGRLQPLSWKCGQSESELVPDLLQERSAVSTGGSPVKPLFGAVLASLHVMTLAVDTDNELMSLKFSNNTASATSYVAALIAAMNVIYERDIKIRLLQGDTFLRVSSTTDPYSLGPDPTFGSATSAQLNEVRTYWQSNYSGISRGLTMMLSGKSPDPFGSSGIAYVPGLCSPINGYSFSQVFRFAGSTGATDAFVVGHEIGHNFGSPHTHNPAGYNPPIDTCATTSNPNLFNCLTQCGAQCPLRTGDGALACNACPAETTINGVTTRGTLMSYCHLLSGCNAVSVFHPRSVDLITGVITPQIGICVFPAATAPTISLVSPSQGPASGGTAVTITGTNFLAGSTVKFGETSVAATFNGPTQLTATAPVHAVGTVSITVTVPGTGYAVKTDSFTYTPAPTVSSLSPNNGTAAGGTAVTINGANFQNGATVTFAGSPLAASFISSTQLSITTPAHATGTVGVTVTNPDTGFGTLANAFFYTPPPVETDFYTLSPCRVLDTRNANGPQGGPQLGPSGERTFPVAGICGVPVDALAVVVNLTVLGPTAQGNLSAYPGNAFYLGTSVLNFPPGANLANNAILSLATDGAGTVKIRNGSPGNSHVILDVTGYFVEP